MGVECILKNSLLRRTLDNVTVVLIAFSNLKNIVFGESPKKEQSSTELTQNQIRFSDEPKVEKPKTSAPVSRLAGSSGGTSSSLAIKTNQNCSQQSLKSTTHL